MFLDQGNWLINPSGVLLSVIQNAVSVAIGKNYLNAETAFHIAAKMRFSLPKNLSNASASSQIDHILNHCLSCYEGLVEKLYTVSSVFMTLFGSLKGSENVESRV